MDWILMDWITISLYYIILIHLTAVFVTISLHRFQSHGSVILHPWVNHFMRFVIWINTGVNTKEWVAIHRRHHMFCDKPGDPHSPHVLGLKSIMLKGALIHYQAQKDEKIQRVHGNGVLNDWVERTVYIPHSGIGLLCLLATECFLFGPVGFLLFFLKYFMCLYFAGSIVNGIGHWWGYRNYQCKDKSKNFSPIGLIIAGEELHNNHHGNPQNPQFSKKWFEFDIAWIYIRILQVLKLASIPSQPTR